MTYCCKSFLEKLLPVEIPNPINTIWGRCDEFVLRSVTRDPYISVPGSEICNETVINLVMQVLQIFVLWPHTRVVTVRSGRLWHASSVMNYLTCDHLTTRPCEDSTLEKPVVANFSLPPWSRRLDRTWGFELRWSFRPKISGFELL